MKKLLRDAVPHEFFSSWMDSKAAKYLDREVIKTIERRPWPGREKNVHVFWQLEGGIYVGWNENPSKGWSFPALKPNKEFADFLMAGAI